MKNLSKQLFAIILVILLVSIVIISVLAKDLGKDNDLKGHWAEETMQQWINEGLLSGFNEGEYLPDENLTRAQYISFINRVFEFREEKAHNFTDIEPTSWYSNEIKRAVAKDYIRGYSDKTMRPNAYVSRIEAAAILTRLVDLEENLEAIEDFTDYLEIPSWGVNSVSAVINSGLMSEFISDTFNSKEFMTRSESISTLQKTRELMEEDAIEALTIDSPGTYGPEEGIETYSEVNINSPDVILRNIIVENDLIISEEVLDGDVTLNNVTVLNGTLIIRGGGSDSIHINGGQYKSIRIENTPEGGLRVVATDVLDEEGNSIDIVISEEAEDGSVILEGQFDEVVIEASNLKIETKEDAKINVLRLTKEAKRSEIKISAGTIIELVDNLTEENIIIKGAGKVESTSGSTYHVRSTSSSTNTSTKPTEKNEYVITIEGDAVENTDYTVSGVNDLTKVEEGTTLTIEAVSKINVDGTNLEIGETTIIEVTESKTITINKQIDQVSAINITTNPIDTSGLAHDAGDVTVALATSTSESAIHYTIDGSNPTVESTLYQDPFTVSNPDGINGGTITVKAIGIKAGMNNSVITTKNIVYNYATSITVNNTSEFIRAIENNNINTITIGDNISGDITATRLGSNSFSIDFSVYELEGSLNLTANNISTLEFNGSANPSITEDLTVTAHSATVTNSIIVGGTITVNDVGSDSWNEQIDGNTIILTDSNGATIVINGNPEDIRVSAGADGGISITVNNPVIITVDEGATVSSITVNQTALGTTITNNGILANVTANSDIAIENNSGNIVVAGDGIIGASGSITGNNVVERLTDLTIDQVELRINETTSASILTAVSGDSYNATSANSAVVSVDTTTGTAITANSVGKTAVTVQVKNNQGQVTHQGTIFVKVLPESIKEAEVEMTVPVLGERPQTALEVESATSNLDYKVTGVEWNETLTLAGNFKAEETYSATVILTSKNDKEFNSESLALTVPNATSVGSITIMGNGIGNKATFTAIFPETQQLVIEKIEVTTQPTKMIYREGSDDELTLEGMVVTEIFNDGTTNDLAFTDYGYTQLLMLNPTFGTNLTNEVHDGQPVVITHTASGEVANTENLTVYPPGLTNPRPLSTDATLSDLAIDGITVSGFDPEIYNYTVKLPHDTNVEDKTLEVTAIANDVNASDVTINQLTTLPGKATVVVTAEDGLTQKTYTINFTVTDKEIIDVEMIPDINVAFGTDISEIDLPSTVGVILDDDFYQNLAVEWNDGVPLYDSQIDGTYTFEGTIQLVEGIGNIEGHVATINVIVAKELVNAESPVIASDLTDKTTPIGTAITLDATATVDDGGTISYRWYSADDKSKTNAQLISGEANATYSPPVKTAGTYYYYAEVTNTISDNGDGGIKAESVTSTVSKITVNALSEEASFETIIEIKHQVAIPLDTHTGLPTGARIHQPFSVTTQLNAETPSYYQMCVSGQQSNFIINYYRINEEGYEEHYFTVRLENAIIVDIKHNKFNVLNNDNRYYPDMITLSFYYGSITWEHVIDGISYTDTR